MNSSQWDTIKHFSPSENFGDPSRMSYKLLLLLDNLREFIGRPIIIHCGYEERNNNSYHCRGMAIDCHSDIGLFNFYTAASRFDFTGLGVYPWWNNPGLHLDIRPIETLGNRSLWGSTSAGVYTPLTQELFA